MFGTKQLLFFCILFSFALSAPADLPSEYAPREDYGQKLEPTGHAILHGGGRLGPSGWDDFDQYSSLLLEQRPTITVAWLRLKSEPIHEFFASLDAHLLRHADDALIPQIGIMMNDTENPSDHYEHEVAAGKTDAQLHILGHHLNRLERPVFLRIGFAFNGEWNNYDAGQYKNAYNHIRSMLLSEYPALESRIAFVWSFSPAGANERFEEFYPGDGSVDWWALDLFDIFDAKRSVTERFLQAARQHGKPVMIAEATPLGLGASDDAWDKWFLPFFHFIKTNPGIKAVCYINRDWRSYERWMRWGDCRLQQNAPLAVKYYHELTETPWNQNRPTVVSVTSPSLPDTNLR